MGDNLCQVRACQLALLARESELSKEKIVKHVSQHRSAEEKVLWFEAEVGHAKKRDGALEAWVSVENFLKKMALDFLYEEDHVFLYQSYFLTKYRKFLEEKKGSFIDSELAQKSLLLGTRKTNRLVIILQRKICLRTCRFVEKNLPSSFIQNLPYRLTDYLRKDGVHRTMYPFYFSSLAAINVIQQKKIPNLFIIRSTVDNTTVQFWKQGKSFSTASKETEEYILWEGLSGTLQKDNQRAWEQAFSWEMILAFLASHEPYVPSVKAQDCQNLGEEYEHFLELSRRWGMGEKKIGFVFFRHVTLDNFRHRIFKVLQAKTVKDEVSYA